MSANDSLVHWKVFELQAALIADEVDPRYLDICSEWFTKRHFQDVIEERSNEQKCGYPLCTKPCSGLISSPVKGKTVRTEGSDDDAFCSLACTERAHAYRDALSDASPVTREAAKHLRPPPRQKSHPEIDELLEILVGKQDSPQKLVKIQPLHKQSARGSAEDDSAAQIEFGPGEEDSAEGMSAATARKPPSVSLPNDKRLIPSAREILRKEEVVKRQVTFRDEIPETTSDSRRNSGTPAEPKGLMWLDNEDRDYRPLPSTASQINAGQINAVQNDDDFAVEEIGVESADPRRSAEIAEWTSSWDTITAPSTGKLKRPIRRGMPRPAQQKTVQWTDEKVTSVSSSANVASASRVVAGISQSETKQVEPCSATAPVLAKKNPDAVNRARTTMQVKVVEREPTAPVPLGKKGVAGINPAASAAATAASVAAIHRAEQSKPDAGNIEGYMPMMENIRVAPSTMLKELSFNPMANPLEKDIREQDEKILSELFGSATLDNSDSASDLNSWAVIADDSETWFVTLWSALEDLFDYECIVAFGDNIGAVASLPMDTGPNADEEDWSGEEENDEAADDQPYLAGNVISGLQAVKRMLLRGVQSAESSLFAKRKLSTTEMNKYVECKSRLIAKASLDRSHHYSLSSTQWNVLGLILVYSILTRADIIAESTSQTPWRQLVNVVMLTLMTNCNTGTAKDAHNPLDDNELNILLNFFHIIDN